MVLVPFRFSLLLISLVGHSPQRACVSVYVVNTFLFSLGIKGDFGILGLPNLLVGSIYQVKNGGCLLEVCIMRLFNRTLSINDATTYYQWVGSWMGGGI